MKMTMIHRINKIKFFLIMLVMGVGSAWAQTEITSLSQITDMSGNYKLTADIDASGNTSLGTFTGTLDGDFHTITGLSNAIFTTVNGGTVKNVILDNVSISGGTDVGAIANNADGNARIYNCGVLATNASSVSGSGNVGSIVGALSGNARVLNCFSYADVSGGTNVAGIVGNNNGTTVARSAILNGTGSMVFNCMFFGQITSGTNKYPVYGGTAINNVGNINTYNYFIYDDGITYANNNTGASGVVDESLLSRFDMYRGILNSHRDLCAMYIYNTQSPSDTQKHDIALWHHDYTQRETIPYLQLEPCIVGTRRTLDRVIPTTTEDYKGKKLRDISCTFVINGSSRTVTLPTTDMNLDDYDYTWGKIILPFANEFSGWTMPASGSTAYDNIITGWEITSISGGTAGSWDGSYDLCNPDCTAKDLYSNSNYVWAQGGNYVVPTGVTAITFTAHIARAVYLADSYVDIAYNNTYTTATNLGTQITGDTYNGKTVYHSLKDAYTQLQNKTNPADQAIVLVGNYHELQKLDESAFVDAYYVTLSNTYAGKAATYMSIDADNNQVPDYNMPFYLSGNTKKTNNSGRTECPPIRFDFLCCPGVGISSYTRNGYLADVSIFHSKGWLEFTETCMIHTTEFEIRPQNFTNNSPVILNGGIHEKILQGTRPDYAAGTNDKLTYIRFGGKVYINELLPGHKNSDPTNIKGMRINVSGGQIDKCYMTSDNTSISINGDINFYCNGGYIKEFLGAYQQKVTGNVTTKIDHALIDAFYGGGNYDSQTAQIAGNIDNTINNSYVRFYCAGPKFGMMAENKTVTTHATGTTFGEYYGAGYGGTALTKVNKSSYSPNFGTGDYTFARPWTTFTNDRLKLDASNGTGVGYSFLFNMYAGGAHQGNEALYVDYARLSLASTRNVSSTLVNCTLEHDFYGGGCQGMVDGTITNSLTNCSVAGSVFGGGYKASATPIEVYPVEQPTYAVFKAAQGFFTEFGTTEPEVYTWVSGKDGAVDNTAKTIGTSVDMTQMGLVTGAITTTISGGTVGANVFGGGNESPSDNNATVIIKGNAQVAQDAFGGGNIAPVGGNTNITLGEAGVTDNTQVTRAIYGGGALANVGGNTTVNLLGGKVTDVYGGGLGAKTGVNGATADVEALVSGNTTVTLDGSIVNGEIFGCNNLNGTPKGHAKVHVLRTTHREGQSDVGYDVHAIYGGGNLAAYIPSDETLADNDKNFAEVLIENCENSIEYVYGGGNAAPVPATKVTIIGANAIDNAFAGGNGAGTDNPGADIGYLGFFNSGSATEYGTGVASINIQGGEIHHVYGGSNTLGYIKDHAEVNVNAEGTCTMDVAELYGGGKMAPGKAATINIVCTGEGKIDNVYGGAHMADLTGDITLNIHGGQIGNAFGGNNVSGNIDGAITVNIDWATGPEACGENSLANVYGGGNLAPYTTPDGKVGPTVNLKNGTVSNNVYGGGYGEAAVVTGNPIVNLIGATVNNDIFGGGDAAPVVGNPQVNAEYGTVNDIFAGGRGETAVVTGNPLAYVNKTYDKALTVVDVYGGGDAANVNGTGKVQLDKGTVNNIYGGGNAADVTNTDVVINGGQAAMAFAGGHGDKTAEPQKEANVSGDAHLTIHGGTVAKAFAGSNSKGTITGSQLVTINKTDEALAELHVAEVYGGGNQADGKAGTFDIGCTGGADEGIGYLFGGAREAEITGDIAFTIEGGNIGSIFGGNNVSGNVDGSITVNIAEDTEKYDCGLNVGYVYGGGQDAAYNPTTPGAYPAVNIQKGSVEHDVFGGGLGAKAVVTSNPVVNISGGSIGNNVFGGGSLAETDGNPTVNVTGGTVTHDVYGGGALADVTGNTTLSLTGGAVGGAYGGALGQKNGVNGATSDIAAYVNGNTNVTLNGTQITETGVFGCNNLNGTPKGHAYVHVLSTTPRDGYDYAVPAVYGGGNLSAYEPSDETYEAGKGYAAVVIENCDNSIEYVYGGGNAAPVPATEVTIFGANAINHAFAGGNGAGIDNPGADVGYLGYYSNGHATEYGTGKASITVYGGTVNNVYGGSNTLGYIRGGTSVSVENGAGSCPLVVGNVFGGGNEADIACSVTMNLDCNEGGAVLYAGANNANVNGDITLNIHSGTYGKVFCGNNTGGKIFGSLKVNVDETGCWPVMIGELYGCGNEAPYSVYGYDEAGHILTEGTKEYSDPEINLISFTRIGKVFGGGYGPGAVLYGDTRVNVEPIKGKFAGYDGTTAEKQISPAFVLNGNDERVTFAAATTLPYGIKKNGSYLVIPDEVGSIGSIYGGGNAGAVYGNTNVNIGLLTKNKHISGLDTKTEEEVAVTITGDVFGGGNEAFVSGDTNVKIGNEE